MKSEKIDQMIECNALILRHYGHTSTLYKLNQILRTEQLRIENGKV